MKLLYQWIATIVAVIVLIGIIAPNCVNAHNTWLLPVALLCYGIAFVIVGLAIKTSIQMLHKFLES